MNFLNNFLTIMKFWFSNAEPVIPHLRSGLKSPRSTVLLGIWEFLLSDETFFTKFY